ncbi:acetamidase/formamidase family protein [Spiractinospora alimapuensis]|uniref:acetamidase/formamidase family protein n=1 Tax=Spiractinospora alimapuensis TaxID=2820884 RepID=UPI001F269E1E|nr:acetamidase/formamidase family protein [Spiractinospora alimapuensis]QVQ53845.1 acetamidase/formamidase family protein [Spiractinospora alimapuensis]
MAEHEIRVDYEKSVTAQETVAHNRWHPDVEPVITCQSGDEVVMETLDALDGQLGPDVDLEDLHSLDLGRVHPLTGPIHVEGAEPGDLLDVEVLEIQPDTYGATGEVPGFGFLRDHFPEPFLARWDLADGWATWAEIPGVRVPGAPFLGLMGVAPSHELLRRATERETAAARRGEEVLLPDPAGAVPGGVVGEEGLRTVPPRENGGNLDIKQLSASARLQLPVFVPGALFSCGDAHFAQGDCESCGMAIEMRSTARLRFTLRKGEAARRGITTPHFQRDDYWVAPHFAAPRRFLATTGMPITNTGENRSEDLTEATRQALLAMIDLLGERGYTREQAYAICSVAVDLKISQVVDVPNVLVSAFLPLDIFEDELS